MREFYPGIVPKLLPVALLILSGLPGSAVCAAADLPAFPAQHFVDRDEGTVEWWMCFKENPLPAEFMDGSVTYKGWGPLLNITTGDPLVPGFLQAAAFTKADSGAAEITPYLALRVTLLGMPPPGHYYIGLPRDIKAGDWHHIAIAWDRENCYFYLNGERTRRRDGKHREPTPSVHLSSTAGIILGARADGYGRGQARYIIDEFRISMVAREAGDLGFHGPLDPDLFTTLLLKFEESDGSLQNLPDYTGRTAGKFGLGLDLGQ